MFSPYIILLTPRTMTVTPNSKSLFQFFTFFFLIIIFVVVSDSLNMSSLYLLDSSVSIYGYLLLHFQTMLTQKHFVSSNLPTVTVTVKFQQTVVYVCIFSSLLRNCTMKSIDRTNIFVNQLYSRVYCLYNTHKISSNTFFVVLPSIICDAHESIRGHRLWKPKRCLKDSSKHI